MTPRGTKVPPVEQEAQPPKRNSRQKVCPECGEMQVRRSRRRTLADYFLSLAGMRPYRCRECSHRFHARNHTRERKPPRRSRYAQCPRCGFTGVNRIARSKVPRTWSNFPWRLLPVSGYRCPECRKRFFDYRAPRPKD